MIEFQIETTRPAVFDKEVFTILQAVVNVENPVVRTGGPKYKVVCSGASNVNDVGPTELEFGPGAHERWVPLVSVPSPHVGFERGKKKVSSTDVKLVAAFHVFSKTYT